MTFTLDNRTRARRNQGTSDPNIVFRRARDPELFDRITELSKSRDLSKAEIVRQCISYALKHLEDDSNA